MDTNIDEEVKPASPKRESPPAIALVIDETMHKISSWSWDGCRKANPSVLKRVQGYKDSLVTGRYHSVIKNEDVLYRLVKKYFIPYEQDTLTYEEEISVLLEHIDA